MKLLRYLSKIPAFFKAFSILCSSFIYLFHLLLRKKGKTPNFAQLGFTLSEVILTMTILGIIAAVGITTLKPHQYKTKALLALKQKTYTQIYNTLNHIIKFCTPNNNFWLLYNNCNKSQGLVGDEVEDEEVEEGEEVEETGEEAQLSNLLALLPVFMKGTPGACGNMRVGSSIISKKHSFKLKNGVCIYGVVRMIFIDVNGDEGPNDAADRFWMHVNYNTGEVVSDMPTKAIDSYACGIFGCAECNNNNQCTKCYCGFAFDTSGRCHPLKDWVSQGCNGVAHGGRYTDSSCSSDSKISGFKCVSCATSTLSSQELYIKRDGVCVKSEKSLKTCSPAGQCEPF